eukprot:8279203-Pyramimonas_sp.AAC.1
MRHAWRERRHQANLAHQARLARSGPEVPGARGASGTRGAPRPSVAHMGSVLVPSSCPSKDDR